MASKKIFIIAFFVTITLVIGLSINGSINSNNNTQSKLENAPLASFVYFDSSFEEKINEVSLSANEYKSIKAVQEYQGADKKGRTIEELTTYITESLLVEEKKTYPSTNFGWTGLPNDLKGDDLVFKVIYEMQTDEQKFEVIYNINLDTNEIWGENEMAKNILILSDMPE